MAPETPPTGFAPLESHQIIAWDFDDTLVGHSASAAMHDYIALHPHQRHLIVTFRWHSEDRLWEDLSAATPHLNRGHFAGVRLIDRQLAETVQRLRHMRARRLYAGPDSPAERAYRHWKGMICAQMEATLLVDDRTEDVQPGCQAFGVFLLHPDQLA